MKRRALSIVPRLLVALAVLCGACACDDAPTSAPTVRVFAAASLTDVVGALASQYGEAEILPSFGGSSALARQIRDGAPADVFVSASQSWIDFLGDAGVLAGEPRVLARNRLVAIAPQGSPLVAGDPRGLLAQLEDGDRVAIADLGVPAGEYARAALENLDLLDAYRPFLVGQSDVRAVLHAVELGEVKAGFVYATDAAIAATKDVFVFDPSTHPPIEYQAVALKSDGNLGAAEQFLTYLESEPVRTELLAAGFVLP